MGDVNLLMGYVGHVRNAKKIIAQNVISNNLLPWQWTMTGWHRALNQAHSPLPKGFWGLLWATLSKSRNKNNVVKKWMLERSALTITVDLKFGFRSLHTLYTNALFMWSMSQAMGTVNMLDD